jgi:phenylalanyl-tRNA synthetase beta chain
MLVSYNWLKQYVDFDMEINEFCDKLTMSGTNVEKYEVLGADIKKVVIGEIISISEHPNAEKLIICTVDVGENENIEIVTGAQNVYEGAIVPVALVGSTILNGKKIINSKLRGVMSYGMLCSIDELRADTSCYTKEELDGIYLFSEKLPLGEDVKPYLGLDDIIIEVELTANRADCQSIIGIAREVSAMLDIPMKMPETAIETKSGNKVDGYMEIKINNELCSRFVGKMFKVKKIKPSPIWMQKILVNAGVRPINNIVDITNFVMLETGQPMHAYDYSNIGSQEIIVDNTKEKFFTTLDSKKREIDETMLMITNGSKPIGIAGIMGGENSEIKENTEYVFLESATFDKHSVRLTSKQLGLRTEASGRYEKGVNEELAELAVLRSIELFVKTETCEPIEGYIDVYPNPQKKKVIEIRISWINSFIGISLNKNEIVNILNRLNITISKEKGDILFVAPPLYRDDLEIKEDIVEEIARIYGYNNIPNTLMSGDAVIGKKSNSQIYTDILKNILTSMGYYEILTTSFTSENKLDKLGINKESSPIVINPLGEENKLMRNSLLGNMTDVIGLNNNKNNEAGKFFEIAQTYKRNGELKALPVENKTLCIGLYGSDYDFYTLKGAIETILAISNINNYRFVVSDVLMYHPGRQAALEINDTIVGAFGEIHPEIVDRMSLPDRTYTGEFDVKSFEENCNKQVLFKELPKYPSIIRDLAIVVDDNILAGDIEEEILNCTDLIEELTIFDIYKGKQVPEGAKSIAYSITFRDSNRTLKDEEINTIMNDLLIILDKKFSAKLR